MANDTGQSGELKGFVDHVQLGEFERIKKEGLRPSSTSVATFY